MVKLLKQSSISCTLKHKGSTGGLQRHTLERGTPVNDYSNKNIARLNEHKYLSETGKMTERMASGWMTVWRLDTGGAKKRFERRSQDGGSNGANLGRYHQGKRRMQRGVRKRANRS